eukprot:16435210-Heterocapsa_arctica.AAC.1
MLVGSFLPRLALPLLWGVGFVLGLTLGARPLSIFFRGLSFLLLLPILLGAFPVLVAFPARARFRCRLMSCLRMSGRLLLPHPFKGRLLP